MGFKFLRTGSLLYRTNQQQVRPSPAMGFKILSSGTAFDSKDRRLKKKKKKKVKVQEEQKNSGQKRNKHNSRNKNRCRSKTKKM